MAAYIITNEDWLNGLDPDASSKRTNAAIEACYAQMKAADDFGPCEGCPMSSMCHEEEEGKEDEELDFFQREANAYYEAEAGTNG